MSKHHERGAYLPGERPLPKGQINIGREVDLLVARLPEFFRLNDFSELVDLFVDKSSDMERDPDYPWLPHHEHHACLQWNVETKGRGSRYASDALSDAEQWVESYVRRAFESDETVVVVIRQAETEIYRKDWTAIVGLESPKEPRP